VSEVLLGGRDEGFDAREFLLYFDDAVLKLFEFDRVEALDGGFGS
jgi:hypothetical protein